VPLQVRDYDAVMLYGVAAGLAALPRSSSFQRILVSGRSSRAMCAAIALKNRNCSVFASIPDDHATGALKRFGVQRDPGGLFPFVVACPRSSDELESALRRVEPEGHLALLQTGCQPLHADLSRAVRRGIKVEGFPPEPLELAMERLRRKELCEALSRARNQTFRLADGEKAATAAMEDPLTVLIDNLDK